MPLLFREIVFCDCGRPAMLRSETCRTCYEDGLRRKWREELGPTRILGTPEPIQRVGVRELRKMTVWRYESEAENCSAIVESMARE